ncbi:unnamed protein product [Calicophoron daubneyi]|uniref:Uncharacterized protein n=1 Tax=Calicophoron daubneyi TaxID=300641 RepID=A0AAV2SXI7_CALDB
MRLVGSLALAQMEGNIENTLTNFLPLIGRHTDSLKSSREETDLQNKLEITPDGHVRIQVDYLGHKTHFYPEHILAMLIKKLRDMAQSNLGDEVRSAVLNVPIFCDEYERGALLEAASLAGLDNVELLNETTAGKCVLTVLFLTLSPTVCIAYAFNTTDSQHEISSDSIVAFVLMGYCSTQVCVCTFRQGQITILATSYNRNLGGRNFDFLIFEYLKKKFDEKYGTVEDDWSILSKYRLLSECRNLKERMSGNSDPLPIHLDYLVENYSLDETMDRRKFEDLSAGLLKQFQTVLEECLDLAKVKGIDSVEMVGGGMRIPALKAIVKDVFKREGRVSLRSENFIVRGCTLKHAMSNACYAMKQLQIVDNTSEHTTPRSTFTAAEMKRIRDLEASLQPNPSYQRVIPRLCAYNRYYNYHNFVYESG